MEFKTYEIPKITLISLKPNGILMDGETPPGGNEQGVGSKESPEIE